MGKKKGAWLLLAVSVLLNYGYAIAQTGSAYSISTFYRTVTDTGRTNWSGTGPRVIKTVTWFPQPSTNGTAAPAAMGSTMGNNKYPLLILSHGANSTAEGVSWIGKPLAEKGYIVVAPVHIGDSAEERPGGVMPLSDWHMWERPQDIAVVLDDVLKDTVWGRYIQKDKIGAIGFSLGGYTVLATGGATLDMDAFKKNSLLAKNPDAVPDFIKESVNKYNKLAATSPVLQNSLQRAERNYRDKRIKAIFALSPAIGEGFTKKGLRPVKVPVMIVVGDKDLTTPKEANAFVYAKGIKKSVLKVLPGEAGHVTDTANPLAEQNKIKVNELSAAFFDKLFKER